MSGAAWDSWNFSNDQREKIGVALEQEGLSDADVATITNKLRAAVLVTEAERHYPQPQPARLRRRARAAAAAAEKLQEHLHEICRLAGGGQLGAWADFVLGDPPTVMAEKLDMRPGPVARWMRSLNELRERLASVAEDEDESRPGPRPDPITATLHRHVYNILKHHGVPVTTYRYGTAASVLQVCHQAATGTALKDPFRALRKAKQQVGA